MNKIFKVSLIILIILIITLIINKVDAASATISGNMTVTQGDSVTVTALVNAGAWNLRLEGAGKSEGLVGQTSVTSNTNASTSITFTASSVGTYTFTLKGDITDYDTDVTTSISKSSTITVKAPEPTPTTTTSSPTTGATTTNPKPNNTTTTTKKSSNNNLSNLGIQPNDFTGFTPGKTTYSVTVPNEVTEVNLYATKQDAKAKITGTGKKQLNEGANALTVTCTAENGSSKTYTVNVTREAPAQVATPEPTPVEVVVETQPVQEENKQLKLESLEIVGFNLEPEFNSDTYIYNVKIDNENVESLTMLAEPNYDNAKIIVSGNENLKPGENKIVIEAILEDSDKSIKYTIFATKPEAPDYTEEVAKLQQEAKDKNLLIFVILIIAVISIGINIYFIIDKFKNRVKV